MTIKYAKYVIYKYAINANIGLDKCNYCSKKGKGDDGAEGEGGGGRWGGTAREVVTCGPCHYPRSGFFRC